MPRLAEGFVAELKDRIDLYDLVSRYVQLKKSGSSWVGLSPFNKEKTASFYVHPIKGFFNCFSSGEKGDGITFVQKMENLDFYEAIEYLSREFSYPLRFQEGTSNSPPLGLSIRKELFTLQETVKDWFREQMKADGAENEVARKYWLEERNFSLDVANDFGVGYAPTDRFLLGRFLKSKTIPEKLLAKSGLFYERKNQSDWVSIFCGRLMIPIREKLGRICGFTGRKLSVTPEWGDKKAPKYVNSPETPIFHKGQLLFNLDLANKEINENNDFLLVEGQLDSIRCYVEGFKTTVAPQGTAFKDTQADLMRKSNPRRVVCLLDGDKAGQKAALSYVPIFLKSGLDARFATLPDGSDPDQILVNHGSGTLKKIIEKGEPMVTYVCGKILSNKPTPQEKRKVTDFFFPTFTEMESLVIRDSYLNDLAEALDVPPQAVKSDFQKFSKNRKPAYQERSTNPSRKNIEPKQTERLTTAEDDLLYCLLHDVRLGSSLAQIIDPSWLDTKVTAGRILAKVLAEILADGPLDCNEMEELLEADDERFLFQNLLFQEAEEGTDTSIMDIANHCISALFAKDSRKAEKTLLNSLHNPDLENSSTTELRLQLKQIRSSRNSPPKISETELVPKI
jgi:DNA primase